MQELLDLVDVRQSYGPREVLKGISLSLRPGECLALLGPNGAGKSTTIQLALGLQAPQAGTITLLGHELPQMAHVARKQVGVVPQYDALDPDFTVRENLEVFGQYFAMKKAELAQRVDELLAYAALDQRAGDSVSSLSGGLRRRLALARALINTPRVVFLDEPTTALDPQAKHLIWERLTSLKREGLGLFLTTHFMDEAQRLADRVAILDHGQIIALDTPSRLIAAHVGAVVLEVWGPGASDKLAQLGLLEVADKRGETYYLKGLHADSAFLAMKNVKAGRAVDAAVTANAAVPAQAGFLVAAEMPKDGQGDKVVPDETWDCLYRPGNLEDVFFCLTGRDLRDD